MPTITILKYSLEIISHFWWKNVLVEYKDIFLVLVVIYNI